jgi:undecaprenyl diphosphate synthase
LVETAGEQGVEFLTVFSFSSENWRRPKEEIKFLFNLLRQFVESDLQRLVENGVKVVVIGRRAGLEKAILSLIDEVESRTQAGRAMQLNLAFNYGAQLELADAARALAERAARGEITPADITPELLETELATAGVPPVDVIFRTGGEQRLSNFMLWQSAYAEFVFMDEPWPEFDAAMFARLLAEYGARQRRFGGLGE